MADKFTKGVMGDHSAKVMPFPTIDRVSFYREHMDRSMTAIAELNVQLQQVQDMLFNEVVEFETCVVELQSEIQRLERLLKNEQTINKIGKDT
jgi:hypothetical protein